ncbi:DUF2846 domain-containing protein [Spirosoma linguale]|uniref:DUF2846 domain-containing protein n=1 Tax=Spirosoma linguale (strain ATCC 33905 / DSM 74 / LMG 10896 / Claus 1) TaxID=504472 RepID=D2QED2_SPILD|nr:hypothetical protein Slin_0423 [Spirosoma linguale DSM 74]
MRLLILPWLLFLLMGSGQPQNSQPEQAQLILYREKEFISGMGKGYPFKINEEKMGKLSPNRYLQLAVNPGRIKLEFDSNYLLDSRPLWLRVQAGQTYYVKVVVEIDFLSTTIVMAPIDPQKAQQELSRMKPEYTQPIAKPD